MAPSSKLVARNAMDPHSILDKGHSEEAVPAEPLDHSPAGENTVAEPASAGVQFPAEDGGRSLAEMAQRDLAATLQLLAERAQYITGATGAAIALRDSGEMVCRASAGPSAPEVGTQLQINSGLSGESVRTRQTLRCDDAHTDERVNRESCEALGIRSVVVMPLLRDDQVLGVFELFSDKANIFEARDITALERMGFMVHTALEHSAAALGFPPPAREPDPSLIQAAHHGDDLKTRDAAADDAHLERTPRNGILVPQVAGNFPVAPAEPLRDPPAPLSPGIAFHMKMPASPVAEPVIEVPVATVAADVSGPESHPASDTSAQSNPDLTTNSAETAILEVAAEPDAEAPVATFSPADEDILGDTSEPVPVAAVIAAVPVLPEPAISPAPAALGPSEDIPAPVTKSRGAVANLRKCESCGFPVSEGRQLCLDCEKKKPREIVAEAKPSPVSTATTTMAAPSVSARAAAKEIPGNMPNFLSGEADEASWLASHKLMVIAVVLALIVLLGVLLFR
jgi:putative methionine-R-sulfoxide reductase with GAF domain